MASLSARSEASAADIGTVFRFVSGDRDGIADAAVVADPTFGNPREMPVPSMVEAIRAAMRPQNPAWFAGKTGARDARAAVAASRRAGSSSCPPRCSTGRQRSASAGRPPPP
jgi:aspartate aminotransferase